VLDLARILSNVIWFSKVLSWEVILLTDWSTFEASLSWLSSQFAVHRSTHRQERLEDWSSYPPCTMRRVTLEINMNKYLVDVYSICSTYISPFEPSASYEYNRSRQIPSTKKTSMSIHEPISWTSRLIGWNSHWALFTWWKSFRLTRSVTEFAQQDLQQCPRFILASETRGKLVFFIQSKSICVNLIDSRPCLWFQLLSIVFENISVDWSISDRDTHCMDMLSWHQQLLLCSSLLVRRSLYCKRKGGCCRGCPTISAIQ